MRIPINTFKVKSGPDWDDLTTDHIFENKRILIVSLPGAFTPVCSSKQLPSYDQHYEKIVSKGIDEIYILSVNDYFVMKAWFNELNIKNVKFIPDGNGSFTRDMDMLVNKPEQGFGMRSWRYAMIVDNKKVEKMFIEPGKNHLSNDNDPYVESNPEKVLDYLGT
jgi:peroxiredoxin